MFSSFGKPENIRKLLTKEEEEEEVQKDVQRDSMVEKKKRKSNVEGEKGAAGIFWRKREKIWLFIKMIFLFFFIFFSKSNCHMSYFKWSKRTHLFPLI